MVDVSDLRQDEQAWRSSLQELFQDDGKQIVLEEALLEDLAFNVRCKNCLRQLGLRTLGELNRTPVSTLMSIPAFGWGTLERLLNTYALTFSQTSFDFCDENIIQSDPSFAEIIGGDLSQVYREYPVTGLTMSARSANILRSLDIQTVDQLLAISPRNIEMVPKAGIKTLADIEQALRQFATSPQEQQQTAPASNNQLLTAGITGQTLRVEDVAVILSLWCHALEIPPGCRKFDGYDEMLSAVLEECIRSPRRRGVFVDHHGLFSPPMSRTELAEKHEVTPSRIYQLLTLNERTRNRLRSFRAAFSLPVAHLLEQHRGVLSVKDLEQGLADQFSGSLGTVRGAGLLELLSEYQDLTVTELTVLGRGDRALALAPPVTPAVLEALMGEVHECLENSPEGLPTSEVQQLLQGHWVRVMPDSPVPDVAAIDLAWLHPKIVVENGLWRTWRRRQKSRVTSRVTLASMMEAVLAENGYPMLVQDLFSACREQYGEVNILACRTALQKNDDLFRSYGRGIQGLTRWGEFEASEIEVIRAQSRRSTPRTLSDKIETILEEVGLPMHFQDLFHSFHSRFEDGDERSVRSALFMHPERFQAHGNGVHGLKAWGEDAAVVLEEAAVEFLERRGYPASETEVCDGLRDQFPISAPVCRWALRRAWERSGVIVPLEGAMWDVADEEQSATSHGGVSVDDLLLEQLLSC